MLVTLLTRTWLFPSPGWWSVGKKSEGFARPDQWDPKMPISRNGEKQFNPRTFPAFHGQCCIFSYKVLCLNLSLVLCFFLQMVLGGIYQEFGANKIWIGNLGSPLTVSVILSVLPTVQEPWFLPLNKWNHDACLGRRAKGVTIVKTPKDWIPLLHSSW